MQAGHGPDDADAPSPGDSDAAGLSYSAHALEQVRAAHATLRRLVEVIEQDGRYPVEAFRFLQEGLDHSVKTIHGATAGRGSGLTPPAGDSAGGKSSAQALEEHPHHVDGGQLCHGLRDLALRRWGRLAKMVLNSWNINATADFGEMVFVLVEHDFLQKTDRDRREDFEDVYSFRTFEDNYRIEPGALHCEGSDPDGE